MKDITPADMPECRGHHLPVLHLITPEPFRLQDPLSAVLFRDLKDASPVRNGEGMHYYRTLHSCPNRPRNHRVSENREGVLPRKSLRARSRGNDRYYNRPTTLMCSSHHSVSCPYPQWISRVFLASSGNTAISLSA